MDEQQMAGDAGATEGPTTEEQQSEADAADCDQSASNVIEFPTAVIKRLGHLETAVSRLQQAVAELTGTKLA